jgi:hypothetical protein
VTEALDVFRYVNDLLQVLILPRVEDWVVDYDSVDGRVGVGGDYGVFDIIFGYFAEGVVVSTVARGVLLAIPISCMFN